MTNYTELMEEYKDISIANSIRSVLSWDIETSKMPAMGLEHRSKQFGYIAKLIQQFWQSPKIGKLISSVNYEQLDEIQKRNVDLIRDRYQVNTNIPAELVINRSSQANKTNEIWKKAKARTDFSIVKPSFQDLFNLNRDYADKLADIKDMNNPYDALIDERDEGLTSKVISSYFSEARSFLVDFIKRTDLNNSSDIFIKNLQLPRREQVLVTELIAKSYNYPIFGETAKGNIDEVEHPLTIRCGPDDVRITVKYGDYIKVMNSTHHELGHAIHRLGRTEAWDYTPINDFGGPSMGECNSRYTENKIGKSFEYYAYFFDILNEITSFRLNNVGVEEFYNTIIEINPSTQRMTADEVTYGLHIIIRFELEQMMFQDQVTVDELPQVWNNKYDEYLGVEVPNDTMGIMQDLHWYSVYWGYFHGYFMGDLLGAQYHTTMNKEVGRWQEDLCVGNLSSILNWHHKQIYSQGNRYAALDHLKVVTGESLNVKFFKDYITAKYKPQ